MPTRHSAHVSISFDPDARKFHLYLVGYGKPESMRQLVRLAFRTQRRLIMVDPERFVLNFLRHAQLRTECWITRRAAQYVWDYRIDLLPRIPTVSIYSHLTDIRENRQIFEWIGSERTYAEKKKEPKLPGPGAGLKRRGRPTSLSRLGYVDPPDWALKK